MTLYFQDVSASDESGFRMAAVDGERRVLFRIPRQVAIDAMRLRLSCYEPFEFAMKDRATELRRGCETAYRDVAGIGQRSKDLVVQVQERHLRER